MVLKAAVLFLSTIVVIATADAQRRGPAQAEEALKELTDRLSLTAQQQDSIRVILQEAAASRAEARDAAGGNRKRMMDLMTTIRSRTDARIESVLTKKQMSAYEKFKEERDSRSDRRPAERMGAEGRDMPPKH